MVVMLKSDSESSEAEVDRRQEGDRREARSSSRMRPSKMILRLPDSSYERGSGLLKRRALLISVAGLFALNGACGAVFSAIELRREMERARDVRAEWDRVLLVTGLIVEDSKHNLTRMDIEWMRSSYRKANSDVEMGCGKCDRAREGSARDGFEGHKTSSICDNETDECHWRFVGAMFFAFTCVTTIGFGDFSPRTHSGKGFVVVVTTFGMAVAFAIFAEIGERIAVAARRVSESHASVVLTAALVAYVFAGGAYFHGLGLLDDPENPDVLVGAYFCFVSISTLGLGDVLPRIATFSLLSTYAYTVLGIALLSATMHANAKLGAVTELAGDLAEVRSRRRRASSNLSFLRTDSDPRGLRSDSAARIDVEGNARRSSDPTPTP